MGNKSSSLLSKLGHTHHEKGQIPGSGDELGMNGDRDSGQYSRAKHHRQQTVAIEKLFQKLELTADGDNAHPGELSRVTFENAFHGSMHGFGKLMYLQMVLTNPPTHRERITREQFVKEGKEILKLAGESSLVKYYFRLFASGKDVLTLEDARQMFEISFVLTLSLSKILYQGDERDGRVFNAMVTGLFGVHKEIDIETFCAWYKTSCPSLFECVHDWVTHILTGSALPEEMEHSRVPLLEAQTKGTGSISMPLLWLLSVVLPSVYTKQKEMAPQRYVPPATGGASATLAASLSTNAASSDPSSITKDPMFTSWLLLRKMARLPQCESWKVLYNSQENGTSFNRFAHHVCSYHAPNLTFFSFEGRNMYCLALDKGWSDGPNKFGGEDCRVIQLLPVYRVVQAGKNMVRMNESARGAPTGIQIGCDGHTEVLHVPKDFDKILHYSVPCELFKIEVWGCGSDDALEAQRIQKKWEASAVQKAQNKKLRPYGETWEDSPDKQILQWGGLNAGNHSSNFNR